MFAERASLLGCSVLRILWFFSTKNVRQWGQSRWSSSLDLLFESRSVRIPPRILCLECVGIVLVCADHHSNHNRSPPQIITVFVSASCFHLIVLERTTFVQVWLSAGAKPATLAQILVSPSMSFHKSYHSVVVPPKALSVPVCVYLIVLPSPPWVDVPGISVVHSVVTSCAECVPFGCLSSLMFFSLRLPRSQGQLCSGLSSCNTRKSFAWHILRRRREWERIKTLNCLSIWSSGHSLVIRWVEGGIRGREGCGIDWESGPGWVQPEWDKARTWMWVWALCQPRPISPQSISSRFRSLFSLTLPTWCFLYKSNSISGGRHRSDANIFMAHTHMERETHR